MTGRTTCWRCSLGREKGRTTTRYQIRPVSRDRLLDAVEVLANRGEATLDRLGAYLNTSQRRAREIASLLEGLGLVERVDHGLQPTRAMQRFAESWERGNLRALNAVLRQSSPAYDAFLQVVEECGPLRGAAGLSPEQQEYEVISSRGFSLTAYDTLSRLAVGLGAVHRSGGKLYYALNDPTWQEFDEAVLRGYEASRVADGYADMGEIADSVCRTLGMSLVEFETRFAGFWSRHSDSLYSSSSALQTARGDQIVTLGKRGDSPRFDRRYLSDGVNVKGSNIKALRVEDG